jgi:hypothetical protein
MNPELPVRATSTDIYKGSPSAIVRNNNFNGRPEKTKTGGFGRSIQSSSAGPPVSRHFNWDGL